MAENQQPPDQDNQPELQDNQTMDDSFKHNVEVLLRCPVCKETVTDPCTLDCGHFYCEACIGLLDVEGGVIKCIRCDEKTPISEAGYKKHVLAAELVALLNTFSPKQDSQDDDREALPPLPAMVNGGVHSEAEMEEESIHEDGDELEDIAADPTDTTADDTKIVNGVLENADDEQLSPPPSPLPNHTLADVEVHPDPEGPETPSPAQEDKQEESSSESSEESEEDTNTGTPPEEPAEAQQQPKLNTVQVQPLIIADDQPNDDKPKPVVKQNGDLEQFDEPDRGMTPAELASAAAILNTKKCSCNEDEQESQSGSDNADKEPDEHSPLQQTTPNIPVINEQTAHTEAQTLRISEKPKEKMPESDKLNGDVQLNSDETGKEKALKSTEEPLSVESQQSCDVNNSLLTPPVSTGSIHSDEQNDSRAPSEIDSTEIQIQAQNRWLVKESASNIELVNKNKIVVTRWTYDDNGIVQAYDSAGNKIKYTNGGHDNYSGIALSSRGCLFVINTNKDRIEEYDRKGKKIKHISVANYKDPHAVDVMSSGEVLVVDRDQNNVRIIGQDRKKKPKVVKNSWMLEPCDIACCKDGFYVSCTMTRCILKFDMDGKLVWSYNTDPDETKRNKLKEPQGICVDEKGNLYVVDTGRRTVLVFNSEGEYRGRLHDKLSVGHRKPWYISVKDGDLAILFEHNLVQTYTFV